MFPLNTLSIFLDDLQRFAKELFDNIAEGQAIIEKFFYHQLPPHLRRPVNRTDSENGSYKEKLLKPQRVLELNGLEAADEPALVMSTRKIMREPF